MLAGSIAESKLAGSDSKLSTISTAGKVDLAALEIDGGMILDNLTSSDLIIVMMVGKSSTIKINNIYDNRVSTDTQLLYNSFG